jgi:hypothetical protein
MVPGSIAKNYEKINDNHTDFKTKVTKKLNDMIMNLKIKIIKSQYSDKHTNLKIRPCHDSASHCAGPR